MSSLNAVQRLVAEKLVTDPPNNDKNYQWQTEMEHDYHGKMRTPGQVLPEGTFTKSPSEIANLLKQHSTDYGQAQSKLNSYINRQGKNLQGEDKSRLYETKDVLKNAYGVKDKSESSESTANADYPLYCTPDGHAGDNPTLYTGFDEDILDSDMRGGHATSEEHFPDKELATVKKVKIKAVSRLNAVLGPSTNDSSDDAFQESKTPSSSDVLSRLRRK